MEGCWNLGDLYDSPEDPSIEEDKLRASMLAGKLKRYPSRNLQYRRFFAVTEKLDSYAYLLASVNLNNRKVSEFCRNLREYTAGLRRSFKAADPGENGNPALCQEYDQLLSSRKLQPGYTKQLYHRDEEVRRRAYCALEEGWLHQGGAVSELYNRHLSEMGNGFIQSDAAVLISAVENHSSIPEQFYLRKARLLGKERMNPWDIFAPVLPARDISWEQAKEYAVDTADMLGPAVGRTGKLFFENHWVDYSIRSEKRGGAFTHPAFPSHHPYIFLNFSGSLRDALALIHELFHGIHFYLAGQRRGGGKLPAVAQSEAVSSIGELMSLETLNEPGIAVHLVEMLILKLFRQVLLFQWEESSAACFRDKGSCSPDELSNLWLDTNKRYFGDGFAVPDSYRGFWIYISHLFHFPLYGINYALGTAAALAFMKLYRENPLRAGRLFRDLLFAGENTALSEWIDRLAPGYSLSEVIAECFDQVKHLLFLYVKD